MGTLALLPLREVELVETPVERTFEYTVAIGMKEETKCRY